MKFPRLFILATIALALSLPAQIPQLISYQGRVIVGTTNFNGAGQFKFALVNGTGSTTFWSNNGTSVAGSQPTAAVTLAVTTGMYSVLLGDATLPNMTIIPNTVFNNPDVRLRVWFNDGTNGFQLFTPDQRIAAVGYAMMAAVAQTVPDGAITSPKIAAGAVQAGHLAAGAVGPTQLATDAVGSSQILDGSISTSDLAPGSVTAAELGADVGLWLVSGADLFRPTGSVGVGTSAPGAVLQLESEVQTAERLRLAGAEFYEPGYTSSDGIAFLLGTNRSGNRQLWMADSAQTAPNNTNRVLRFAPGFGIDCISTDATTLLDFWLGSRILIQGGGNVGIGTATPAATLDVNGSIAATTFSGDGAALTNVTVANGSITSAKLAAGAVLAGNIASGAVGTTQLANGAVSNVKLANSAVTVSAGAGLVGGGAVSLGGSVTLSNAGVTSLAGGGGITVSGGTGAITLGSNATANNTVSTLVVRDASGNFSAGTITASLAGNASTATTVADGAITTAKIAAGAVGTTQVATGAVGNAQLANSAVTVSAGAGLAGGGAVSLGGLVTLSNAGVTSLAGGGGITVSGGTGAITLGSNATANNTVSTLVLRDASGNFSAGTITATLAGNATTATTASTATTVANGAITSAKIAAGAVDSSHIADASVVNADINAAAAIADTKLATISTAGKVANAATTATNANTASTIVLRDGSGNFSAGTITASLAGNATSATSATSVPAGTITFAMLDPVLGASLSKLQAKGIEYVPVGNPGNSLDPATTYGIVAAAFQIAKHPVTNDQYAEFLNAVGEADPNGLYSSDMKTDPNGGIIREGASGSYVYSSKVGMRFKPVVFVSWYDAIRFCNWLHNGKPTGPQGNTTTEMGAYTITGAAPNWTVGARQGGALHFLPTENQWYKAAYYDPLKAGGAGYWLYPTKSNTQPTSVDGSTTLTNSANYDYDDLNNSNGINDGYATTPLVPYSPTTLYLTDIGSYTVAVSAYGTLDQGGNVFEWNETLVDGSDGRGARGGSWDSDETGLRSTTRNWYTASYQDTGEVGFRVAKP